MPTVDCRIFKCARSMPSSHHRTCCLMSFAVWNPCPVWYPIYAWLMCDWQMTPTWIVRSPFSKEFCHVCWCCIPLLGFHSKLWFSFIWFVHWLDVVYRRSSWILTLKCWHVVIGLWFANWGLMWMWSHSFVAEIYNLAADPLALPVVALGLLLCSWLTC